jgi:hypothetical protein
MRDVIKQVFGIILDARQGFHRVITMTEQAQAIALREIPGSTVESLDQSQYFYADGPPQHHPDDPTAAWLHETTQGELKRRNLPGGLNDIFIGNMALVVIYTYWENHYRAQIASALGTNKNNVSASVFGDIRLIRNSIVHHRGIALAEVERCEVLKWFREGAEISISTDQFRQLSREVNGFLDTLLMNCEAAA